MRKRVLSIAIAAVAALSFAAPSQAEGLSNDLDAGHEAHAPVHDDSRCFWKKVHQYDAWGNLVVRQVRVCR